MGGLGMTSGPFEYRFKVRGIAHLQSSGIVERSVVNDLDRLARRLVA